MPLAKSRAKGEKYGVEWQSAGLVGGACALCGRWYPLGLRRHCRACGNLVCGGCQHLERIHVPQSRNPKIICNDCAPSLLNAFGMDPVNSVEGSRDDGSSIGCTSAAWSWSGTNGSSQVSVQAATGNLPLGKEQEGTASGPQPVTAWSPKSPDRKLVKLPITARQLRCHLAEGHEGADTVPPRPTLIRLLLEYTALPPAVLPEESRFPNVMM